MSLFGFRLFNRCSFRTDFSLFSCDLERGHAGPHHVPSDPSLPPNMGRAEQEDWDRRMRGRLPGQTPRPK